MPTDCTNLIGYGPQVTRWAPIAAERNAILLPEGRRQQDRVHLGCASSFEFFARKRVPGAAPRER
jgi:hypothetical protein